MSGAGTQTRESAADKRARELAEDAARTRELYGKLADDAVFLRQRGFTVTAPGKGQYRIDDKEVDWATFKALADRERRLASETIAAARSVEVSASGLKVGQVIALRPKGGAPPTRVPAPKVERAVVGAAKVAQEANKPSADLGEMPKMAWLRIDTLHLDHRYQRDVGKAGTTHIYRIMREFNWSRCQPLVVAEKLPEASGDAYVVIDGQHRLEAARKHGGITKLPCYIVAALDVAAQAAIFSSINGRRLGLTSQQKFFSALAAGELQAVAIDAICQKAKVRILRSPPSSDIPPCSVLAPFTLAKILTQHGPAALTAALELLVQTHATTVNGFRSPTLSALARIAAGNVFSRARMERALRQLDLEKFYVAARNDRIKNGGALESAAERVLRAAYGRAS